MNTQQYPHEHDHTNATTHFGYDEIALADKPAKVQSLFQSVSSRYDLMNDIMSGGLHRAWKSGFMAMVNPRAGERILDVAGGTGDIATKIAQSGAEPVLCDFSHAMISAGIARDLDKGIHNHILHVVGDGMNLPFADKSFDVVTIVFGLRNFADIDLALGEFHRVLRYGGRLHCLEFSTPVLPILSKIYDHYSFQILPLMGQAFANNRAAYQYLAESIRQFPDQETLRQKFITTGFGNCQYQNFSAGICAQHSGWRI